MQTVLFVCTGNTCRSPMAEAIARHHVETGAFGGNAEVFVASAGVQASDGAPPTAETLKALRDLGIEHDGHSKKLTAQMIRKAHVVFCMTDDHLTMAQAMVSDSHADMDKVMLLNPDADVEDPIGMGQEAYNSLAKKLTRLIPARLKETLKVPSHHAAG